MIQRFGCDIHVHILFLAGVYVYRDNRPPRFQRVKAPKKSQLEDLVQSIGQRLARSLECQGLLEQDTESALLGLNLAEDTDAMPQILCSSITYRIAVGPQQGRKAFMILTIRPMNRHDSRLERAARANGFSLHAGRSREGIQKDKRWARKTFRRDGIFPDRPQEFPTFTEFHGQGGLHSEDAVSGLNDTNGIRTGGFRCPSVCPGTQTPSQPHSLQRRHRSNIGSHTPERTGNTKSATAGTTDQSATLDVVAFRWQGFQANRYPTTKGARETGLHGRLGTLVQD